MFWSLGKDQDEKKKEKENTGEADIHYADTRLIMPNKSLKESMRRYEVLEKRSSITWGRSAQVIL